MNPPRIALYGHDTLGLGHLRRNLALAAAMSAVPAAPDVLVLSSAVEATSYDLPPGVDVVLTPGIQKDSKGTYGSRRFRGDISSVLAVRRAAMSAAIEAFDPEVFVIDKVPYGFRGELLPLLEQLRNKRTRVVLGMRDVLDEPVVARAEWRSLRLNDALHRHVEQLWVYGDQRVHDLGGACAVPPMLRRRMRYTGYLSRGRIAAPARPSGVDPCRRFVLCTVGGGQDGAALASAFANSTPPPGTTSVLVTGKQMAASERDSLHRVADNRDDLIVIEFHPQVERWFAAADAIVAMGGYNTVAEILSTSTPALVVPRTTPRAEQAVRARALSAMGQLDCMDQGLVCPGELSRWLSRAVQRPRSARTGIDLDGVDTVTRLTAELLGDSESSGAPEPSVFPGDPGSPGDPQHSGERRLHAIAG